MPNETPAAAVDVLPPLPKPRVIGVGRETPIKLHYGYTAEQMREYALATLRRVKGESA